MTAITFDGRTFKKQNIPRTRSSQYVYWKCMRKGCSAELRSLRDLSRKRLLCGHTGRCSRPGELKPKPASPEITAVDNNASKCVPSSSPPAAPATITFKVRLRHSSKTLAVHEMVVPSNGRKAGQRPPKRLAALNTGRVAGVSWQEQCDFGRAVLLSLVASPQKTQITDTATPETEVVDIADDDDDDNDDDEITEVPIVSPKKSSPLKPLVSKSAVQCSSNKKSPVKETSKQETRRTSRGERARPVRIAPKSTKHNRTRTKNNTNVPATNGRSKDRHNKDKRTHETARTVIPSTGDYIKYMMLSALTDDCIPAKLMHVRSIVQQPRRLLM